MQILAVTSHEELASIPGAELLPALTAGAFSVHHPDSTWVAIEEGKMAARSSTWYRTVPHLPGETLGLIGHWADRSSSAAVSLLDHSCGELTSAGCTLAVGPMDGNTWRSYRFVTDRGSYPPFFLEPGNPESWPRHFAYAGFHSLAQYSSALTESLTWQDPRLVRVTERIAGDGIQIRMLNPDRIRDDLRLIFELSLESFRNNLLYTPIDEKEFFETYERVMAAVDPRLVLLAEDDRELLGYIFALPDLAQRERGEPLDTIIIKTLAVRPGRRCAGLGALLAQQCMNTAGQLGYARAIHALMHSGNHSRNISAHTATTIRRYALLAKQLGR